MHPQEMTEAEQQALRDGLRILARMIARRHLEQQAIKRKPATPAGKNGVERSAAQPEGSST